MVYTNKFVATLKQNGKVLREFGDKFYLPFGSEYSIFLKNLHSKRALVTVKIDGKNVAGNNQFVINANSTLDIERYVENLNQGGRFKFIERTQKIEDYRGIGVEDGLIQITFQYEADFSQLLTEVSDRYHKSTNEWPITSQPLRGFPFTTQGSGKEYYGAIGTTFNAGAGINSLSHGGCGSIENIQLCSSVINDNGITVPGSTSTQQFKLTNTFNVESEIHTIVMVLKGSEGNKLVEKIIDTKTKRKCDTCGKSNRYNSKFCRECGTSLQIF